VRLAAKTGTPIVPCVITGAEETHVNLGQIEMGKLAPGLKFPIPLNLLAPLPAKWRIRFLPPVQLSALAEASNLPESVVSLLERALPDSELDPIWVEKMSEGLRLHLQGALDSELSSRPYVFLSRGRGQKLPIEPAA
jgi:1-acyl-sn-glycerol-3-phosphate acyltransferase